MEVKLARAILNEAENGGYLDGEIPEEKDELIRLAEYYADEAKKVYEHGNRDESVVAIVNMITDVSSFIAVPVERDAFFNGLPHPSENLVDAVEMPAYIHDLSDEDVRKYQGIFNHYYGRARWLLAEENSRLAEATHLRDEALRVAYAETSKKIIQRDERPTKDLVLSIAKDDREYREWDDRVREHENNASKYKALVDIYSANIERLSREATVRHNEFERTR